jgi:hypothetical protein
MPKSKKTRQQKIILNLKRQIAHQTRRKTTPSSQIELRQEVISQAELKVPSKRKEAKKPSESIFFYNPRLVSKDLLKSLSLTAIVVVLEIVLYLNLR